MSVKLEDVAKAAGFSVPTVSRVLANSSYPVSEATRQRILQVAKTLGYRPNLSARSLRTDRTNTIGILVDDLLSPFVPPIVRGVQDCLGQHDFFSLIVNSDFDPNLEREAIDSLVSRPVDGIIFVEYSHRSVVDTLERSHKPHVFVHRLFGSAIQNSVVPDDFHGASLAVQHLIALGHRRIAYINGPGSWHTSRARFAAYRSELAAHAIAFDRSLVQPGNWEFDGGYTAACTLLALPERPTAVFAANDLMAIGAIYAIQDAGLRVPKDVAVVGYDNRDVTKIFRPRVTTVSMPVYEMGFAAAELILRQIVEGQGTTEEIKIKGQLFVRESCGTDESLRTVDEKLTATTSRRILLDRQPEN